MRLFVAIELHEPVKKRLVGLQESLKSFSQSIRWMRMPQMHLTMKFLGSVPDDVVEKVCHAARGVADQMAPLDLVVTRCGCFPPRGSVRIVYTAVEQAAALQAIAGRCEEAYASLGFDREVRPFTPHLTIGRVQQDRTGGRLRQAVLALPELRVGQIAEGLCVFQSVLMRGGAEYTAIARCPFRGEAN